jgi:hypothetical protein
MHLSRRRNVIFFAEKTLRPGDGKRYVVILKLSQLTSTEVSLLKIAQ